MKPKLEEPRTVPWNFRCPVFLRQMLTSLPAKSRTRWLILAIHEKIERDGGVVLTD